MTDWLRRPIRRESSVASAGFDRDSAAEADSAHPDRIGSSPTRDRQDLNDAYERGRLDERRSRRASPLIGLVVIVVVVFGTLLLYLAARNGSFQNGGAVVDNKLSAAEKSAAAPLRGAAEKAGSALENAGRDLKRNVGDRP